jgi:hypothetical protein
MPRDGWVHAACISAAGPAAGAASAAATAGRALSRLSRVQCTRGAARLTPPRPASPAEDGYSEPFTINSTGVQFYINTTYGPFREAEENCQFNGGHLATYTNVTEQVRGRGAGGAACRPGTRPSATQPRQPRP